jgi:branched-chain amino acid aminotransferase
MKQEVLRKVTQQDVFEILLSDDQGRITEGSKSNIFFVSGRKLITAPRHLVLPGITRQKVIEIAEALGVRISYKSLFYSDLNLMEGAFLTGTSPKVLPVCQVDEVEFSVKSELIKQIMKRYNELIEAEIGKA